MLERRVVSRVTDLSASEEGPDIRPLGAPRSGEEANTASMLQVFWRRRWIILACVVVALASAVLYLSRATPIYSSGSQLYLQQNRPTIIDDLGASNANDGNYLLTQCEVLKSTAVLSMAVGKPELAGVLGSSDNPVGFLKSCISAQVGKDGGIITVTAESPSPQNAAVIVNAIVEAYMDYENQTHRSTAAELMNVLQKEKDREEAEFTTTSKAILDFRRQNGMLSYSSDKGNIILLRLGELSQALTAAQLDAMDAQLSSQTVDELSNDPQRLYQFLYSQGRIAGSTNAAPGDDLLARDEQLKYIYGPKDPILQEADRQLQSREQLLEQKDTASQLKAISGCVAVVRERAATAQRRVDALQQAFNAQQDLAKTLNAKAAQLSQLESSLSQTERLLDTIDSRMKEIHVNADADASDSINVLETGKPAFAPIRPQRAQVMGMGLVSGLMIGACLAMLLDWMDQRIRSADEIALDLELPVLGVVPHMVGSRIGNDRGQEVHLHPKSDVAEAYRGIRTAIQFSHAEPRLKTLLVTSPSPGDGKTTAACNLAIAIAQGGRRVLLIDADCRRPMIHKIFKIDQKLGLADVLVDQLPVESAILHSSTPHLDILPAGNVPPNPAELLHSDQFNQLLSRLETLYDHVIFDSPPVAPVTDARILTALCDATILVLRAERTSKRISAYANATLRSVGGAILGLVINDAPRNAGGYGYYRYGYYHYGYGATNGNAAQKNGNGAAGHAAIVAAGSLATNGGAKSPHPETR